jgi:hypothetical protein
MDPATLRDLHRRAETLRDFLMHAEEKAQRPNPVHAAARVYRGSRAPSGYVALSFGFEDGGAVLYAPIGRTKHRAFARLLWDEIESAAQSIDGWVLDLLEHWPEVQKRWAQYVEAHGRGLSVSTATEPRALGEDLAP